MRADMAKVIVERPRRGRSAKPGSAYPHGAQKNLVRDLESAPSRESMGRGYATKDLNENLRPLWRYLGRQVGRPWRLVHAEMAAHISVGSAVQKHVLDHLRDMVVESVWREGNRYFWVHRFLGVRELISQGNYVRYFVCPAGLLRAAPRPHKVPKPPDPDRRVIDESLEFRRMNGVWFEIRLARIPLDFAERTACFDVLEQRIPEHDRWAYPVSWRTGRYAVSKRQLCKREISKHGLRGP